MDSNDNVSYIRRYDTGVAVVTESHALCCQRQLGVRRLNVTGADRAGVLIGRGGGGYDGELLAGE